MKKILKACSIFAVSALSIFTLASCGKKKTTTNKNTTITKSTTKKETTSSKITTNATTKEVKTSFKVNVESGLSDVSYKLYSVNDGKKTLVDNTKEFKKDDKVIIEIINRSTSHSNIKGTSNDTNIIDTVVKSKSQKYLEEITISDDVDISITKSNKYYIDFTSGHGTSFTAYYFDDNNVKHEFDDDFTIDKKTKIYFTMINDSTGSRMGYIKKGDEYLDYVICDGKGGHNAVIGEFDSEGYEIDSDVSLVFYYGDSYTDTFNVYLTINPADVTLSCVDAKTSAPITLIPDAWDNEVPYFAESVITVSNPNEKRLVIGLQSIDGTETIDSSDKEITINYKFNSAAMIEIMEYTKYELSIINNNTDVFARFYTYDSDNIETDLINGSYDIFTNYYFELVNNSKYDLDVSISMYGSTNNITIHAFETFTFDDYEEDPYLYSNVIVEIVKTENETKYFTVVYDGDTIPEGLRLGINRGMYDYPDVPFGSNIVSGTKLVAVCEYVLNGRTLKVIDVATNQVVKQDSVGGSCAISFTLNGNYKIIVE